MLHSDYIRAVETRLAWLRWAKQAKFPADLAPGMERALPQYVAILEQADTFYMNPHFARLVDHARVSVPDSLRFDAQWLQAPRGWLYLDAPFQVPLIESAHKQVHAGTETLEFLEQASRVQAVGWRPVEGLLVPDNARTHGSEVMKVAPPGTIQFCCFQALPSRPHMFFLWSYFLVRDGVILGDRVASFEAANLRAGDGSNYVRRPEDVVLHPWHEIRWIYTALYLMAQRLSLTVQHVTDRHTRRRAERQGQMAPSFIRVITLRRLEAARKHEASKDVEWHWQWEVRGHWRNQFYPSEGIHKPKFIEAYVKGPPDKPLKEGSHKLFAAVR